MTRAWWTDGSTAPWLTARIQADIARITAQAKAAGRKSVLLYVQRRNIGNFVPVQIGAN